jgi:F-type H+-transporting ATPase subunit alpha
VSRVGSAAQTRAMSKASSTLKGDLSQFRELAAFAQFGSDLDPATQRQLARGERLMELLKQPQYQPLRTDHEVFLIYAGTRGYLDNVELRQVQRWKAEFTRFMDTAHSQVGKTILETGAWNDKIEEAIKAGIVDFNNTWSNQ